MSTFAFLRGETLEYARSNIRVGIGHLTFPPRGEEGWCANDLGCFSCTVANVGSMLITNFKVHIYTSGSILVRGFPRASNSNWASELQFGPFSLEPNEVKSMKELQFKVVRETVRFRDAVFAYVDEFDLTWCYYDEKRINVF